ncbi:MAG: ABC-F family ATP-binding cassette domain-containing protein [Clostridia bacterium]
MSILNVENLSISFGSRKILENASFRLLKGEHIGLVGANGEGKSTFLNVITGSEEPDSGTITWCNRVTIGYLDQYTNLTKGKTIREVLREAFSQMYELEKEMLKIYDSMGDVPENELQKMLDDVAEIGENLEHNGFYMIEAKITEYANGLGLGEIGLDKDVTNLSGGQRAKVLLAKLLLQNPMILVLDEPTNFLDENHIKWLHDFLLKYDKAFILVSHDMSFLNEVVNVIFHVENASLTRYSGNYDKFLEMYALKKKQQEQAYERQQKQIATLETFIAKNKARASTASLARSRQKELEKIDVIELDKNKIKPIFKFKPARTPGRVVIEARDLVIGYKTPLTHTLNFKIERNSKIAIFGVNGLGKSTLLKTLLGIIPPISGEVIHDEFLKIGYFEQEQDGGNKTAFNEIWDLYPSMTHGEVCGALAKCGLTNQHIDSLVKVLSGGEAAKVRLCKLMLKEINLLVLDEPTNHLDVVAKEELKQAIMAFKGTVLLVSHDNEFYTSCTDDIWDASSLAL